MTNIFVLSANLSFSQYCRTPSVDVNMWPLTISILFSCLFYFYNMNFSNVYIYVFIQVRILLRIDKVSFSPSNANAYSCNDKRGHWCNDLDAVAERNLASLKRVWFEKKTITVHILFTSNDNLIVTWFIDTYKEDFYRYIFIDWGHNLSHITQKWFNQ